MNLFIFNKILNDPIISALLSFKETNTEEDYCKAAQGLIKYSRSRITDGSIIKEYLLRTMLEQDGLPDITELRNFLRRDVKNIYNIFFETDWDCLAAEKGLPPLSDISVKTAEYGLDSYALSVKSMTECTSNEALGGAILAHAESFGTGTAAAYAALRWNGLFLEGIEKPDSVRFEYLYGLEEQKRILIENTEKLILGKKANNVLLSGGAGLGKSACIKACLNLFKDSGLRMIELRPSHTNELPDILRCLDNKILKYIIFIDGFESTSADFDSAVSGSAETAGDNVLIYAASDGSADAAKASRFGIRLDFPPQTGGEYIGAVEANLAENGIAMTEELKQDALKWVGKSDFSGRCAEQFVASILNP